VESVPGHCQIESFRKMGMAPLVYLPFIFESEISDYETQTYYLESKSYA